jgi:hypothetical protein
VNDLLQLLLDLPRVEQPVRWPDPPDVDSEFTAAKLVASPHVAEALDAIVQLVVGRVEQAGSLAQLLAELDMLAVHALGHGEGELGTALLDLADVIRGAVDR